MSVVQFRRSGNVGRFIARTAGQGALSLAKSAGKALRSRITKRFQGRKAPKKNQRARKARGTPISRGDDQHSGIGGRSTVITLNKRLKGRGLGTWKFAQNYALTLTSTAGFQGVLEMGAVCLANQFLVNTAVPNVGQIRQNLFDLNYERAISGSGLIPATAQPATDRMAVFTVRSQMMFTNLGSAACVMTLYFLTPRRDCDELPASFWDSLYALEDNGVALRARSAPGNYSVGSTVGGGSSTDVFAKPTDLAQFKKFYRVLKVMKIKLAASANEEVNVTYRINKLVDRQKITEINEEAMKGHSVIMLATVYGQAVHDTTVGPGTQNITTAATKVGMVQTNTYFCGMTAKAATSRVDSYFTHQQIASAVPAANQAFIDNEDNVAGLDQA